MNIHTLLSIAILVPNICALTGSAQKGSSRFDYALLRDNGNINPAIRGYWKSIGNGYILDATSDSILLYSYTTNFCYKEKNDYIEGLLNSQARFSKQHDTISIYPTDFGERTFQLQVKNDFVKIDGLPGNCIGFSEMQQLNPKILFNLFIETLAENYAFSKERKLNWLSIKEEYGKNISDKTTREDLFQTIGKIVTLTHDHHTKIIDTNGRTLQFRGTPSAEIVTRVFNKQSLSKNLNDYFNLFFQTNYKNISDSLLQGKGEKTANGQIEWGSLDKKTGYIGIYSFTGFVAGRVSRKQEIDSLNSHLERIINALQDKEAIIVDISFNFGGYDAAVLCAAGFFTDTPVFAYTSQVYKNGLFYDESKVYVQPSERISYTKPVYLLMTDISRSAAEGFAMAMKVLPNVKLAGTNTMGILSGMLGKSIGDFYSTSSNQRLLSPHGNFYEVSGVEPGIKLQVFSEENIFGAHKEAVRKLVEIIEKDKNRH